MTELSPETQQRMRRIYDRTLDRVFEEWHKLSQELNISDVTMVAAIAEQFDDEIAQWYKEYLEDS